MTNPKDTVGAVASVQRWNQLKHMEALVSSMKRLKQADLKFSLVTVEAATSLIDEGKVTKENPIFLELHFRSDTVRFLWVGVHYVKGCMLISREELFDQMFESTTNFQSMDGLLDILLYIHEQDKIHTDAKWSSLSYVTEEKYRSVEDTVKPPMTMAEIADALAKIEGYTYLADMLHPSRLVGHEHTVMARFMEKVREKIQHPVVVVQRYGKWTAQYPVGEDEWTLLTDPQETEIQALAQVLLNV